MQTYQNVVSSEQQDFPLNLIDRDTDDVVLVHPADVLPIQDAARVS